MSRRVQARLGLVVVLASPWLCAQSYAQGAAPEKGAATAAESAPSASEPLDLTNEPVTAPASPAPAPVVEPAPQPAQVPGPAPIVATEEMAQPASLPRPNALNFSVFGFVIGNIRLTYERLLLPKHGVFGEAIVAPDFLRGFDFVAYGAAAGYRFHWGGPKTSGFVGGTFSVTHGSGRRPTLKLGDTDPVDFTGSVWTIGIAPHVGKRWLFEPSGVNLTLRFGGGFAYNVVDPSAGASAEATHNLERSFIVGDGELSVGYSF
jgi:hypothetical protein